MKKKEQSTFENMQLAVIEEINNLMKIDPDMVMINADFGLLYRSGKIPPLFPERILDVGIAEADMIGIASGMAYCGRTVFTTTLAAMVEARVTEQIKLDVCYPNLNVKMFGHGRGLSFGEAGFSHIAIEDYAILRSMPNLTVLAASDTIQVREIIKAAYKHNGPVYIAVPRGGVALVYDEIPCEFEIGKANTVREGGDMTIIAAGDTVAYSIEAADILKERHGVSARVLDMASIKPLDREAVIKAAKETGRIMTVESHNIIGGLGGAVAEVVCDTVPVRVKRLGVPDCIPTIGMTKEVVSYYKLDAEGIVESAMEFVKETD